ncbi:MAG TPA: prolyl aminopeptidase [Spongiibacteraceae bacterium]|nr:prolyl aminopeptidase [Spongiibacteraceae bacterium]HCS27311.1 prolyl aminopeptidase [Spongiibacteraceae bacterium]
MLPLFPDIKPYREQRLNVGEPHVLHIEESGNPDGVPVLFLHGGPGAGCNSRGRCFFDPEQYRIVLFDQRGAGQSTPHACTDNNTLQDLLADILCILDKLDIERCMLFGGSWGATLALAFAEQHPERVSGMVLRGVFLCRRQDLDWFYRDGASRIFPEAWEQLRAAVPDQTDLLASYHSVLDSGNEIERMAAARAWATWEATCSTLRPHSGFIESVGESHNALALARLETHYFVNQGFLRPNQLIDEAGKLAGIRSIIVHGRYDMVCPLDNAHSLHAVWADSELRIIRDGGHSPFEPAMSDALVHATTDMLEWLTEKSA